MLLSPSLRIIGYKYSYTLQGSLHHSMSHNTDEVQMISTLSCTRIPQTCAGKLTICA